jgi:hypothetical protein
MLRRGPKRMPRQAALKRAAFAEWRSNQKDELRRCRQRIAERQRQAIADFRLENEVWRLAA